MTSCHLRDTLWTEGIFRIDVKDIAIKTALLNWKAAVHCELMADLGLSTSKFPVYFNEGLGFKPSPEEVVDGLDLG